MDSLIAWLLEGPPWIQYRTRLDLLNESKDSPQVLAAHKAMIADSQVQRLLTELSNWPESILTTHKSAGHPLHKLTLIADLGLDINDSGIDEILRRIVEHQSPEGPFQILVNISPKYGGTGQDQWAWMLCDAPLIVYALTKLGFKGDDRLQAARRPLINLIRDNGWPCAVAPALGKFRGPGSKADPCPYANLLMLKMLTTMASDPIEDVAKTATETLLNLWETRKQHRPYMFAMGTDFAKLKAPLLWYDILHVTEVLAHFPWTHSDPRFQQMIDIVQSKADAQGRFMAESIWRDWKEWDFGQKRTPSRWITLVTLRMLNRCGKFSAPKG